MLVRKSEAKPAKHCLGGPPHSGFEDQPTMNSDQNICVKLTQENNLDLGEGL